MNPITKEAEFANAVDAYKVYYRGLDGNGGFNWFKAFTTQSERDARRRAAKIEKSGRDVRITVEHELAPGTPETEESNG